MKLVSWVLPLIFMLSGSWIRPSGSVAPADNFCNGRNTAFKSEERLTYEVYYTVIGLYANAGQAVFTTRLTKINDKPVYHLVGTGTTHSSYDWIYRVRDRYESYIDTTTLQPLRFIRNVDEGGYKINQRYEFNKVANTVSTSKGEYKVPPCIQDVLSAIFYARNLDFSKSKVDDKIPFSLFLDEEVNSMYIRYMGKEVIKTKYGTFRAIKFIILRTSNNFYAKLWIHIYKSIVLFFKHF